MGISYRQFPPFLNLSYPSLVPFPYMIPFPFTYIDAIYTPLYEDQDPSLVLLVSTLLFCPPRFAVAATQIVAAQPCSASPRLAKSMWNRVEIAFATA